jgi:YD repeat-containing protein
VSYSKRARHCCNGVAGNVSRVYQYSQNGNLLSADVDGLLTTFTYDGNGNRLRMSVAGEVTTYTLDTANGLQILMEQGGAFAGIKILIGEGIVIPYYLWQLRIPPRPATHIKFC